MGHRSNVTFRSIPVMDAQDESIQGILLVGPGLQYIVFDCYGLEPPSCALMSAEDILDAFWPEGRLSQITSISSGDIMLELRGEFVYVTFPPTSEADFTVSAKKLRKVCKWAARKLRKTAIQLELPI